MTSLTNTVNQHSQSFWLGGPVGRERGWFYVSGRRVPFARPGSNQAAVAQQGDRGWFCVSARRLHKWSCTHSPPNHTAQFWTGCGPALGHGPDVGDPCSKWAPNSSKCLGLKFWTILNKFFEVSISLKGWLKKRDLLLISLRVWDMFILDLFILERFTI